MDEYHSCYLCGGPSTDLHHVFQGAYKKKSERYGFMIFLCRKCHTGNDGVHSNHEKSLILKRWAQTIYELEHTREEFRQVFGKSYL